MTFKTIIKIIGSGQLSVMLKLKKSFDAFYRVGFIATGLKEGLFERLRTGPQSLDQMGAFLGSSTDLRKLEAWLELGTILGEIKKNPNGYTLKSILSRRLADPASDPQRAFLEETVHLHHRLITESLARIKQGRAFSLADTDGELIARSSRTLEPFIQETMDLVIPREGEGLLLEVGCGAGAYLKHVCERNPFLQAVGLELQPQVAEFARENIRNWGLQERVVIETGNILDYQSSSRFDWVTLHNNIYYFPEGLRPVLLTHLKALLKPGGKFIATTGCRNGGASMRVLNLWAVMTEGAGRLPLPEEFQAQLEQTGFRNIQTKNLMPGDRYYRFLAEKSR